MKQATRQLTAPDITERANRLALYDRYGSMAYGLILRIIPEPVLAQTVLIDLFSSPQLMPVSGVATPTGAEIIRLARLKALAAKAESVAAAPSSFSGTSATTDKVIFDLSFSQGYSLETIAENLQVPRTNVLKSIYAYFQYLRSS